MSITPPEQGIIFWPVGTGDSSTIRINDDTYIHIDLHHLEKSDDDDESAEPIIDHLEEILPKRDGKPYLSTFILTHPDQDHCRGFEELLKRITIGELWLSPRTFDEYNDDNGFCDDATAFKKEADRRVSLTIKNSGAVESGDRVRVIGYADRLDKAPYKDLPDRFISPPGTNLTEVDGQNVEDQFSVFIHAPFKDDQFGDRNDCSVALQATFNPNASAGKALFFGDLSYPVLKRIFEVSDSSNLEWHVMLATHHCSKSAMYWQDNPDDDETLRQHILDEMEMAALDPGYIVSSSRSIPKSNDPGDNPPHVKAKEKYIQIAPTDFLCTHDHPITDTDSPEPIIFDVTDNGLEYRDSSTAKTIGSIGLAETVDAARGKAEPSKNKVGFGK